MVRGRFSLTCGGLYRPWSECPAGSPSAYPLAFPGALASETIPRLPRMRWTPTPRERWQAPLRESAARVTPCLEAVCRCAKGRPVRRGTLGCHLDHESMCPAFPQALLGQADNPRRLVVHHDDSGGRSCAYPHTTLLGGIPWWIQGERLSRPLHSVDGQSQPWGVCIILASRSEAWHLYRLQVIKDLAVSTPHPWLRGHFEGTDRSNPLNMGYRVQEKSFGNSEALIRLEWRIRASGPTMEFAPIRSSKSIKDTK